MSVNIEGYKRINGMIEEIRQDESKGMDSLLEDLTPDISDAIAGINTVLFGVRKLCGISTKGDWVHCIGEFVREQTERSNQIDRDFYHVLTYARLAYVDDMIRNTQRNFLGLDQVTRQRYMSFYRDFSYFFGELVPGDKKKGAIVQRVILLKERSDDFRWLYERLCDYRSKRVLSNIIGNWISFDISLITGMKENSFAEYFDPDVFAFSEDEVIVDLGAYIGDTAQDYIEGIGCYKRIYCYEITAESVEKLKKNLKLYPNIVVRNCGVSDHNGMMSGSVSKVRASANRLGSGSGDIEVVTLDDDIDERITFLKMDIEGAEKQAILGSRGHISEDRPKLAISVYHSNSDIIDIPLLIDSIRDDYKFYLRSHGNQWAPSEITLMGV